MADRDTPPPRPNMPGPGCVVLFSLPFLLAGLLTFPLILWQLIEGDPGDKLQGPYPAKYLWSLFPLPFLAIGLGGLRFAWLLYRVKGKSPESAAAPTDGGPVVATDPLPHSASMPGPYRPDSDQRPGCALGCLSVMLLGLGIGGGFAFYHRVLPLIRGAPWADVFDFWLFFAVISPIAAITLLRVWFMSLFALFSPRTAIELPAHPVRQGTAARARVFVTGKGTLDAVTVTLRCREEAEYSQGEDTKKESAVVFTKEVLRRGYVTLPSGEPWVGDLSFEIEASHMHSFESAHNRVVWDLVTRVNLGTEEAFAFTVLPPTGGNT